MYTLKSIARRGSMLGFAVAIAAAAVLPAASAYAQSALNPLTERSLLLTSSAPGFQDTDGSGYSAARPNSLGENYAPAGSGANGKKTGETFTFRVSTTADVHALTFQYCTVAAGKCRAPGNNQGTGVTREANGETVPGDGTGAHKNGRSDFEFLEGFAYNPTASPVPGTFQVKVNNLVSTATDWQFQTENKEVAVGDWDTEGDVHNVPTGKDNYVTLTSVTGQRFDYENNQGDKIEVVFTPSETVYITNPGDDAFFVKINTYDSATDQETANIIDGGVTVANVMTDSIHITTKVLETMSFSVGTVNDDTRDIAPARHGTCDPITTLTGNQLQLGNPNAEYSLQTDTAYDVKSYWRLSSNSSGGATVYYSGNTLQNTVGDRIAPIGPTSQQSRTGTEQFGLAFVDATEDENLEGDGFDSEFINEVTTDPARYKYPTLLLDENGSNPDIFLAPETEYARGKGLINNVSTTDTSLNARFAFEAESNTVPRVIAQNNEMVISCATAKMRYIANIGADTPAGVYTTKINYLAAPQY